MERIQKFSDVCRKCETDGSASVCSYYKIKFIKNKKYNPNDFTSNKYNFMIGEYCTGCDRWKKWAKQSDDLIEVLDNSILTF